MSSEYDRYVTVRLDTSHVEHLLGEDCKAGVMKPCGFSEGVMARVHDAVRQPAHASDVGNIGFKHLHTIHKDHCTTEYCNNHCDLYKDVMHGFRAVIGIDVRDCDTPASDAVLRELLREAISHLEDPSRFWGTNKAEAFFQRTEAALNAPATPTLHETLDGINLCTPHYKGQIGASSQCVVGGCSWRKGAPMRGEAATPAPAAMCDATSTERPEAACECWPECKYPRMWIACAPFTHCTGCAAQHTQQGLPHPALSSSEATGGNDACDREDIGNDCRCVACEMRKVEAAEYAQEASEGR